MSASYELGIPGCVQRRHTPAKPQMVLKHDISKSLCKCCGRRKDRTKGSTKAGRFVCFDCTGGK